MMGYKSRRLREATKMQNVTEWQSEAFGAVVRAGRRPPDACFCGGELQRIEWEERDGALVAGLWRCLRDDEHFLKMVEGVPGFSPIREFWQPPRMPRQ